MGRITRAKKAVTVAKQAQGEIIALTPNADEVEEALRAPQPAVTLDLDTLEVTTDEGAMLLLSVIKANGGRACEDDIQRQSDAVEAWVRQTKADVSMINLALRGLVDVSVEPTGKIRFRASARAMRQARPN